MTILTVNGARREVDAELDTPLMWVLREDLGCRGVKFGCGVGVCGACTVHVGDEAVRSCQLPLGELGDRPVTTIEGLAPTVARGGDAAAQPSLHAVQASWIAEQVPQCGYCQPGMIMAVAALLKANPKPDAATICDQITNICRCGTYPRIVTAILRAAATA